MSNYERTTRACTFDQIHPDLQQAFRDYFQTHEMEQPQPEELSCCETISRKKEQGWLPKWLEEKEDATITTAILLTPLALIWARIGETQTQPVRAIGASLYVIRVKTYTSILTNDSGLEIAGVIDNAKSFMRGQIGLGPEAAAREFCEKVDQAIEKINPKPTRKFPSWMGGNQ